MRVWTVSALLVGSVPELACSGIYAIRCLVTGKVYVGSTGSFYSRWRIHINDLEKKKHFNRHLQNAWVKYGSESFAFSVLETVDVDRLTECEQKHVDALDATNPKCGFNLRVVVHCNRGMTYSESHKARIAAAHVGMTHGEEARAKLSAYRKGRKVPKETRAKIADTLKARVFTDEHRAKLSEANRRRWQSQEARERQAAKSTGKVHSPEIRAKMSRIQLALTPLRARDSRGQFSPQPQAGQLLFPFKAAL